jgi:hypothetical protein
MTRVRHAFMEDTMTEDPMTPRATFCSKWLALDAFTRHVLADCAFLVPL